MSEGLAKAIVSLIDTIQEPLVKILPSPFNWLAAGVLGFARGLIEELLGT